MFKVKRFRNLVMKYKTIYSDKPELVKQNADYYISNLHNLIRNVNFQLEKAYSILEKICKFEDYLSQKNSNIFWKSIQEIADFLYDKVLFSIEELYSLRVDFANFKSRAEQVKFFHNK